MHKQALDTFSQVTLTSLYSTQTVPRLSLYPLIHASVRLGFSLINDSATSRGDKSSTTNQQNIITLPTSSLISVQKLSCFILSPVLLIFIPFKSFVLPKDIYEIFFCYLEQFSNTVLSLAYKKVTNHIKPVVTIFPENFWIIRHIPINPLKTLSVILFHPPKFTPGICYILERKFAMNINQDQFLWPEEENLIHHFVKLQEFAFAWTEDKKGKFSSKYFNLVVIPTVEHIPWSLKNISIPPGIFIYIVDIIKGKMAARVYEPSNLSYQLCWFCVLKKDRKLLHLIHDLQSLNTVVIKNASLPPMIEQYADATEFLIL